MGVQVRLQEPVGAIGLQACRLEVAGSDIMQARAFQARAPWWSVEHKAADSAPL